MTSLPSRPRLYDFKAFYGVNRIAIWMRCYAQQASCAHGAFGSDYKLVFDVANTASEAYMFADGFPNGRFGFYDFSQASTRYGRFLILCPLGHYCTAPDLSECSAAGPALVAAAAAPQSPPLSLPLPRQTTSRRRAPRAPSAPWRA